MADSSSGSPPTTITGPGGSQWTQGPDGQWSMTGGGIGQGGKKSAPPPPDYTSAAEKMGQISAQNVAQQTAANRPNQNTPFGFSTWTQGPNGQWTQQTGLNPTLQGAMGSLMGQANASLSSPLDFSGLQQLGSPDAIRQQAENAIYARETSRLDPYWQQQQQQMQSQLAGQGLDPGSEAYRRATDDMSRQRTDAYQSALNNAIMGGGAEAQRQFGMNLQARQQGLSELLRQRDQPFEELAGMQSLTQMPAFTPAGQAITPNYLGAAEALGNYNFNAWNQQNQNQADIWKGIMGLGGGLASAGIGMPFALGGAGSGAGIGPSMDWEYMNW